MDGIERLAKMLEGQKDKYLKIIVNHLMNFKELNEAYLNEEKNLKDMATYIKDKAKKQASGGVAIIEDDIVFKWAKDYFIKSNEELKIKKAESKKIEKNTETNDEFGSIFDSCSNENNVIESNKKKEIEQISLFGI